MIFLLYCWTKADITLIKEGELVKYESAVKRGTPLRHWHPPAYTADDLLLVDVADNKIVQLDTLQARNTVITDPRLLDTVISGLRRAGGYRFIVCDLAFDIPTPYDDTLLRSFDSTPSIGFALSRGYSRDPHVRPLEALPGGVVHYSLTNNWWRFSDVLIKFNLTDTGGEKSLPLFIAENVERQRKMDSGLFAINNITFDAPVQMADLRKKDGISRIYSLADLRGLLKYDSADEIRALLKNKFILIGDFANDMHKTAFGDMPGALILFDIFATAADGANIVTWDWLLFLLLSFTIVSWLTFFRDSTPPKLHKFLHGIKVQIETWLGEIGGTVLLNGVVLVTVSAISYFWFNKSTEIICLTLYLSLVDYIRYCWLEYPVFFSTHKKTPGNWMRFLFQN